MLKITLFYHNDGLYDESNKADSYAKPLQNRGCAKCQSMVK